MTRPFFFRKGRTPCAKRERKKKARGFLCFQGFILFLQGLQNSRLRQKRLLSKGDNETHSFQRTEFDTKFNEQVKNKTTTTF